MDLFDAHAHTLDKDLSESFGFTFCVISYSVCVCMCVWLHESCSPKSATDDRDAVGYFKTSSSISPFLSFFLTAYVFLFFVFIFGFLFRHRHYFLFLALAIIISSLSHRFTLSFNLFFRLSSDFLLSLLSLIKSFLFLFSAFSYAFHLFYYFSFVSFSSVSICPLQSETFIKPFVQTHDRLTWSVGCFLNLFQPPDWLRAASHRCLNTHCPCPPDFWFPPRTCVFMCVCVN